MSWKATFNPYIHQTNIETIIITLPAKTLDEDVFYNMQNGKCVCVYAHENSVSA